MIPSIDSYLYNEIESKLQIILSNSYIIEEILKEVQPNVAQNFINAYTGPTARDIPIVYTIPQDKQTQKGAIYIGLREGDETHPSIGYIENVYDFKNGGTHKDPAYIQATSDNSQCFLQTSYPIGNLINVEGLTLTAPDNVTIDNNIIYFEFDPTLVGLGPFNVNYSETEGDESGLQKGFTATESYSILSVSTNMDTVRCLDLIIKAILILMRSNSEELNTYLLQRMKFGQIEEINIGNTNNDLPEVLYGRESIVTYTVSYNLDSPFVLALQGIDVNTKLSGGE